MIALFLALAAPHPADCTAANSTTTTIEAITAQPKLWLDRCVKISGIAGGLVLHSDLDSMYRSARYNKEGRRSPDHFERRIGLDSQELRTHPLLTREARRIEVIGRVDSCERRTERIVAAGGIPFLGGYCHYEGGPTVVATSYRIVSRQYERLVGEAQRRRVGNLVEPPPDWEWRDELEGMARNFAAAVRARDRPRLASLLSYGQSLEEERIVSILREPAYRELRDGVPGEIRLFTTAVGGRFRPGDSGHVFAHLCYCRTLDCSGRWPITSRDADAGRDRPYVCVAVSGRIAPPPNLSLYADAEGGWLAEPAQSD
jgi:hypothetical protein